jgi:hypothetical protein
MTRSGFGPNFTEVSLADGGTTLVVAGLWDPVEGSEVRVAIHAVDDVHKRLEGQVPASIETSAWEAVLDQLPDAPFVEGETVIVVGEEISKEGEPFLWANQLTIT